MPIDPSDLFASVRQMLVHLLPTIQIEQDVPPGTGTSAPIPTSLNWPCSIWGPMPATPCRAAASLG